MRKAGRKPLGRCSAVGHLGGRRHRRLADLVDRPFGRDLDVRGHVGFDLIGIKPFIQILAQPLRRGGVRQFASGPFVDQRADDAPVAVDHGAIERRFQDALPFVAAQLGRYRGHRGRHVRAITAGRHVASHKANRGTVLLDRDRFAAFRRLEGRNGRFADGHANHAIAPPGQRIGDDDSGTCDRDRRRERLQLALLQRPDQALRRLDVGGVLVPGSIQASELAGGAFLFPIVAVGVVPLFGIRSDPVQAPPHVCSPYSRLFS